MPYASHPAAAPAFRLTGLPRAARLATGLALLSSLLLAPLAWGQPRHIEEGRHYERIEPAVPTSTGSDRIEITEVFWYGCPQCAVLEPVATRWRDGVTGDLVFQRMPAVWNAVMETHARLFYVAGALDVQDRAHSAAFEAIHTQGKPLDSEAQVRELFVSLGVKAEEFDAQWRAPESDAAVQRAREMTQAYGIDKLPTVVVDGASRVTLSAAVPDEQELMIAVNMLIREIRDRRRND